MSRAGIAVSQSLRYNAARPGIVSGTRARRTCARRTCASTEYARPDNYRADRTAVGPGAEDLKNGRRRYLWPSYL